MRDKQCAAQRPQKRTRQHSLTLLVIVVAMIVGLLAMHVFSTEMGNHNGQAMTPPTPMTPVTIAADTAADLSGVTVVAPATGPDQMMNSMICILALLLTGMLIALAKPALLRALFRFTGGTRQSFPVPGALPGPAPPNLIVLSIFRI